MCDCNIYFRDLKTPVEVDTGINHEFMYSGSKGQTTLMSGIRMPDVEYNHVAWKRIKNEHGFEEGVMLIFGEKEK